MNTKSILVLMVGAKEAEEAGNGPEALRLLEQAADLGCAGAMHALGLAYIEGSGTPVKRNVGIEWLELAYQTQPDGDVARDLGSQYCYVPERYKDPVKSMLWYRRGAALGHAECIGAVGEHYAHGIGVPPDWAEAAVWLQRAADMQCGRAASLLAKLYTFGGYGLDARRAEAAKWVRLALAREEPEAAQLKWHYEVRWGPLSL